MTLKPVQQANGKRLLSSTQQARGRLLCLHGPRYLFVLFSAAYFACTALVVFSFSFRPPASLARTSLSFRSPLGFKKLDFSLVFKGFREKSLFYQKIISRDILGPTWHDLGRFWLPFWPQDRPRATQERPKTAPRSPQDGPRATQDGPRATQDRPRATQDRPKTTQERPKSDQDHPRPPKTAQE